MLISRILDFVILSRLHAAKIEGIGADMASVKECSLGALEAASIDIGDKLAYHSHKSVLDAEAADSIYAKHMAELRSKCVRFWRVLAFLTVASPMSLLLSYHMGEATDFGLNLRVFFVFSTLAWFIAFILTMEGLERATDAKADVRQHLLKSAASIWALGDKAVYSISEGDVQVIRIDAIGSVARKGDDVVIRSRFGEPTATLFAGVMEKSELDEIVSNLKSRIS